MREQIEELEVRLYSAKHPSLTDMPKGGKPIDTADLIIKLVELKERYFDKLMDVTETHEKILDALDVLQDTERNVIRLRYIKGMTIRETAEELMYSERQVYRLQKSALKKIIV